MTSSEPHLTKVQPPAPLRTPGLRSAGAVDSIPRQFERDQIAAFLGAGASVLVVGEAGVGKTQLVGQALNQLQSHSTGVSCVSWFIEASDTDLADHLGVDIAGDNDRERVRLLTAAIRDHLAEHNGAHLILQIEDAHLLGEVSARSVIELMRTEGIAVVATMRSAASRDAPWSGAWRNAIAHRIDVRPFDRQETEEFICGVLGGPVTSDTAWRIWRDTGGNPFHVDQLVREQLTLGSFFEIEGVWIWDGSPGLDAKLLDIVGDDLSRLSAGSRTVLEILALLGPLPTHILHDLSSPEVLHILDRHGLLATSQRRGVGGTSELVTGVMHDLYANAVRTHVSRSRRTEILRVVSETVESAPHDASIVGRYVELAIDCGVPVSTAHLTAATRTCIANHKPRTAARLTAEATITDPTLEHRVVLLLLRAEAHRQADNPEAALRAIRDSEKVLDEADGDDASSLIGMVLAQARIRAGIEHFHFDRPERAVSHLQDRKAWSLARLPADLHAPWSAAFDLAILVHRGYAGEHDQISATCVQILSAYLEDTKHAELAIALATPTAIGLAELGDFDGALELSRKFLSAAYEHMDIYLSGPAELVAAHSQILMWAGEIDPIVTPHHTIQTDRDPAQFDRVMDHLGRAAIAVIQGSWSTAVNEYHAANARFAHADVAGLAVYCLYGEALASAACGESANAWTLLARADTTPRRSMTIIEPHLELTRLDTLIWLRDSSAICLARELADRYRNRGFARAELEALHRYVTRTINSHAGGSARPASEPDLTAAFERILELGSIVTSRRASLLVGHAQALWNGDADLAHLQESELAHCGLWLAPVGKSAGLTRREREIATLASSGLSSKAIAQRLTVSVRTVDSHLSRVFSKTGVHSREELARVLR